MSQPTEAAESWLHQLLHPDRIPPEALAGGMTPETAWQHWCTDRAAEAKGLDRPERAMSSAERWWYQRFDHAHLQARGAGLDRALSAADVEAARRQAEPTLEAEAQ